MPPGLKTKGKKTMDQVFRLLKEAKLKYRLARLRPVGGVAKATSVWYKVDYDCVVYINDESPPFTDVISDFQDIILMNFNLEEDDFKVCPRCLQFTIDGIDFDLLPTTNMVPLKNMSGDTVTTQHRLMLEKIKGSPDLRRAATDNSAGLTEAAVEFVKRQTAFVHKVARLAKFWNTTVFYPKYVSGRSSIMEALAIKAGKEEEEENTNPSMLRAFRLFLVKVREIRTTNLGFYSFYRQEDVPAHILQQRPLLLDPSNPYNNFLHGLKEDAAKVFAKCASETLSRFANVEGVCGAQPDAVSLFEPQPPISTFMSELGFKVSPQWLARTGTCPDDAQPHLHIRRPVDLMPNFLESIKLVFAAMAEVIRYSAKHRSSSNNRGTSTGYRSTNSQGNDPSPELAKEKIMAFIDTSIRSERHSNWHPSSDSDDTYDVTFEIPFGPTSAQCVSISAKWGQ
jgi:hypothetical protein